MNDVAIIDENNIWAVGEIYFFDSTGAIDSHKYNAAHWNGNQWDIKRIYYYGQCSAVKYPPLVAIYSFSDDNLILSNGGSVGWFDGYNLDLDCGVNSFLTGSIKSIWGTSSSDLYLAGNNGNLAHYNGTAWTKINSGTETDIYEIIGILDDNGGYNKYCAAENVLLKLDVNSITSRINAEPEMYLTSVWGKNDRMIYTAGNGVVLYKNYKWQRLNTNDANTVYKIDGQDYNDIVALSSTKAILHFNGYSWRSIQTNPDNIFLKVDIKDNLIAAVGWQDNKAVITVLKR